MNDHMQLDPLISYLGRIIGVPERGDDLVRRYWPDIVELLLQFRLYQYAATQMHGRLSAILPECQLSDIDTHINANRTRNVLLFRQAAELAREFGTAGIPLIFLKGTAAIPRGLFRPDARWLSDIDALIPAEAVDRARAILRDLGYEPGPEQVTPHFHHIEPMYHPHYLAAVELHVKPYGYSVNGAAIAEDILRDAVRSAIGDTKISIPSPTDHAWLLARKDVVTTAPVRLKDGLEMNRLIGSGAVIDYDLLYRREAADVLANTVSTLLFTSNRFFHGAATLPPDCDMKLMDRWLAWSARYYRHVIRHTPFMGSRSRYGTTVFFSGPGIRNQLAHIRWIAGHEFRNEHPYPQNRAVHAAHKTWRYLKDHLTHAVYALGDLPPHRRG